MEIFALERTKNFPGNAFDPWTLIAACSMISAFEKAIGFTSRGVKRADFAILKPLTCPELLMKLGFISNDADARKLAV
jgi:N-acetylmuramoyl-L-alanine amidase